MTDSVDELDFFDDLGQVSVAVEAAQVWKEHGALDYWECVGDDMDAEGVVTFPQLANTRPDETVILAWVVYESREHRDRANEKIMADPRIKEMMDPDDPIFDTERMAFGGFEELVHA